MKIIISILIIILVGCSSSPEKPSTDVTLDPIEVPAETHPGEGSPYTGPTRPFPSATGYFTVKIKTENCNANQNQKYIESEKFITELVNSHEFKNAVLAFEYLGQKRFHDNNGMSNEEIYNHLVKGAEALLPTENYQMDIVAVCYTNYFTKTVGYTYPSTIKIYANMKFHKSYSSCDVAGNTFHEWTHKMGFGHESSYSKSRDYSVPYALGYLVRDLCEGVKAGKTKLHPLGASLL